MITRGIVYLSFGKSAVKEIQKSIDSIKQIGENIDISVVGTDPVEGTRFMPWKRTDGIIKNGVFYAGMVKPFLNDISPYDYTLYLDADTKVLKSILIGFSELKESDICIANHYNDMRLQDVWTHPKYRAKKHEKKIQERDSTIKLIGDPTIPFLNSGVIFFRKSYMLSSIFASWYTEWRRFMEWDEQMALHRAIFLHPEAKVHYMREEWNQKYLTCDTIIWHQMGTGKARKSEEK